jgi:hypothetical protein
MAQETAFDEAWDQWRQAVTQALTPALGEVSDRMHRALQAAGALDPADGCVARDWALGLLTGADESIRPLVAQGLSADDVDQLTALIQRHPLPAAGG